MSKPVKSPQCDHQFDPAESGIEGRQGEHEPGETNVEVTVNEDRPTRSGAKRRGSPLATMIRVSSAVAALVVTIGAVVLIVNSSEQTSEGVTANPTAAAAPPDGPARGAKTKSPSLAETVRRVEPAVVRIESTGAGSRTLGTGFVVDGRGLVATNYHTIADATRGRVRFKTGVVYDIEGYAAVDTENDLAILKVTGMPAGLTPLVIRDTGDPPAMSPVVAIGHPQGVSFSLSDGKVSRIVNTSALSADSRQFLARHTNSHRDHRWIQHTAVTSEGSSGGPLVNGKGEVIGINTWVNRQSNYSYALHARYLSRLLLAATDDTLPLERYARAAAREAANLERMTGGAIERLYQRAVTMKWQVADQDQYAVLQHLAAAITIVNFPERFGHDRLEPELRDSLIAETDQVEQNLRKESWQAFGQFTIINDYAAAHIGRPMTGVFFFGTVERVVEGGGRRAMLVKLAGFDTTLFISLDGTLTTPKPGSHCLILGMSNGRVVRYGDNPLQLNSAPEIVSRTIVPLN